MKHRLNVHIMSLLSSASDTGLFKLLLETTGRGARESFSSGRSQPGRLSSFGFSGTITHGSFFLRSAQDWLLMGFTPSVLRASVM